jgi:hypothetical protein
MTMKYLIAALLTLYLGLASADAQVSANTQLMHAGTLSLDFPPGWRFAPGDHRAEGHGPDGEFVIMNYRTLKPGVPPEVTAEHWKELKGLAEGKMPGLAAKHGNEVRRPFNETWTKDGRVQYSTVSQGKQFFKDYYFLQYMLGSPRMLAYMTVEGYGNAEEAARRFERILATQRWDE